jgi:quercetin dioxygenase-like cupin family protein
MEINRNDAQPSSLGGSNNFTGHVVRTPLFGTHSPSRMVGGIATFAMGARTVWHTHPVGQVLIITFGRGRVQSWGGPVEQVAPGDVVWFAPGEKHWHGASDTSQMSHIALVEEENGETTVWLEPVTPEQYQS